MELECLRITPDEEITLNYAKDQDKPNPYYIVYYEGDNVKWVQDFPNDIVAYQAFNNWRTLENLRIRGESYAKKNGIGKGNNSPLRHNRQLALDPA